MNKNTPVLLCSLVLTAFFLNGCSGVKNSLGLDKESPDEFAVITRAPLEMPPELTLPPPNLGTPRPQEQTTAKQAKEAIFGETPQTTNTASSAEMALLQKAGTQDIEPNIRATVNKETAELHDRNKPVAEKLLNIGGNSDEASATVVDATKERERIKKNWEEGKNITEGETPIIEE